MNNEFYSECTVVSLSSKSAPSFDIPYEKDVIFEHRFFRVYEKSAEGRSEELAEAILTVQAFYCKLRDPKSETPN